VDFQYEGILLTTSREALVTLTMGGTAPASPSLLSSKKESNVCYRLDSKVVLAEKVRDSNHVEYMISVREIKSANNETYRQWFSRHRYSKFYKLHMDLRRIGFPSPRIPPRTWPLATISNRFIEQRKEELDLWLQSSLCIWQALGQREVCSMDMEKVRELFFDFLVEKPQSQSRMYMERRIKKLKELRIGKAINIKPLAANVRSERFVTYSVVGNEVSHNFSPHTATVSFNDEEGAETPCSVSSIPPTPTSQTEFFKCWSTHTENSLKMCADILRSEFSETSQKAKSSFQLNGERLVSNADSFDRCKAEQPEGRAPFDLQGRQNSGRKKLGAKSFEEVPEHTEETVDKLPFVFDSETKMESSTVNEEMKTRRPQIVDCKKVNGKIKFRVQWYDTWESIEAILQFMPVNRVKRQAQSLNHLARSVVSELRV